MCSEFTIGVESGNVLEFNIQYRIGTRKRAWAVFSLLFQFFFLLFVPGMENYIFISQVAGRSSQALAFCVVDCGGAKP